MELLHQQGFGQLFRLSHRNSAAQPADPTKAPFLFVARSSVPAQTDQSTGDGSLVYCRSRFPEVI